MTTRGRFITFEGGEGTGKTTLILGLKTFLVSTGLSVVTTREPGGSPRAEQLRALLLSPEDRCSPMSARTEALIISAARSDHVENVIDPALMKGSWVLSDRYIDSTRAYQGRSVNTEELSALEKIATHGIMPDLTILLDADPQDLIDRRNDRGQPTDRFEGQSIEFHQNVRKAFLECAAFAPDRIQIINALQGTEEILAQTVQLIQTSFPEFRAELPVATGRDQN